MDWESEEARSQATAFGVGLTLVTKNGSAYIRFLSNEVWGHLEGKIRERGVGAYRTETRTLSCPESESVLGSISADISPASTVSKSTRASSGSTLLTSISLVLGLSRESSPPFLRGVVGVLGLLPSDFFVGVPGTTVKPAICFARGLDSVDMEAL